MTYLKIRETEESENLVSSSILDIIDSKKTWQLS